MVANSPRASQAAPRPGRYDDARLLKRYHRDRDPKDREALVQRFLPLALHLSHKYAGPADREDLEQVASVGLLHAIDRFDPSRGLAFSTFAVPTIIGELKRYFRDLGWSVRVPRSLQELGQRLESATDELTRELGRFPTAAELAVRCESTTERVLEALALGSAHRADSLDVPVTQDGTTITRVQTVAQDEPGFGHAERAADLDRLLATIPAREQIILRLRFHEELTQREIGRLLGLSQMHVSRLIRSAIAQLNERSILEMAPAGSTSDGERGAGRDGP
jgi:RNA polymerase sigma-B factor